MRTAGRVDPHTPVPERRRQLRGRAKRAVDLEEHEVCLDALQVNLNAVDGGDRFGEQSCVLVIDRQPVDVVVQCVEAGRGRDPGLTQRTAEELARPPRTGDL